MPGGTGRGERLTGLQIASHLQQLDGRILSLWRHQQGLAGSQQHFLVVIIGGQLLLTALAALGSHWRPRSLTFGSLVRRAKWALPFLFSKSQSLLPCLRLVRRGAKQAN